MPEWPAARNTLDRALGCKSKPHTTSHKFHPGTGHVGAAVAVAVAVAVEGGKALRLGVAALARVVAGISAGEDATMLGAKLRPASWVAVRVGVAVGVAVGRVGVTLGVGVRVDTRTMICAVGPTFPPMSISCAVSSESPTGKACGALI
jgi:hypothetical protein